MNVNKELILNILVVLGVGLFILYFYTGTEYNGLMIGAIASFLLGLLINNNIKGFIYAITIPILVVYIPHYFGDMGKYIFLIIMCILAIYIFWKRYKNGKSLWY